MVQYPSSTVMAKISMQKIGLICLLACAAKVPPAFATENSEISPPQTFIPDTVPVDAGAFITGSDAAEREYAYRLDEKSYGHSKTRRAQWYGNEKPRSTAQAGPYRITRSVITNRQYQYFVKATGHPAPSVTKDEWKTYGLVHPYQRTLRHAWSVQSPPIGRLNHPVVLVSYTDAQAYANWLTDQTGKQWRLPTENEWEKAARGLQGWYFPWGNTFDSNQLNSHDNGPFDTVPVGIRSTLSPFGLQDAAGQVFEWTASSPKAKRAWVKGGSWDDKGCGVCRPAARHARPKLLKHILIGFRLVTT